MSTLSVLSVPSFTEVVQRLIKLIWKPQYVDLTAAASGSAKGLLEYDIIIIGGGML